MEIGAKMKTLYLAALIALFVLIAGCTATNKANKKMMGKDAMEDKNMAENDMQKDAMIKEEDAMEKKAMEDKTMAEKDAMEKKGDTMAKEGTFMAKGTILAGSTTPYIEYNKEDYEKALAENKVVVLYFYANWCPICRVEQISTFAAFNELQFPNVVGFRVNFKDSDTTDDGVELAKQYGVTYQHTKVIIKNGERVLKAPDSWDKERYISEISKYA